MINYNLIERVTKRYGTKDKEELKKILREKLKTYEPKLTEPIEINIGTRQQGKEMYCICKMLEYIEKEKDE